MRRWSQMMETQMGPGNIEIKRVGHEGFWWDCHHHYPHLYIYRERYTHQFMQCLPLQSHSLRPAGPIVSGIYSWYPISIDTPTKQQNRWRIVSERPPIHCVYCVCGSLNPSNHIIHFPTILFAMSHTFPPSSSTD